MPPGFAQKKQPKNVETPALRELRRLIAKRYALIAEIAQSARKLDTLAGSGFAIGRRLPGAGRPNHRFYRISFMVN